MTTGRSTTGTAAVALGASIASNSTDGSSDSPTSAAQAASALICPPGSVAPTGEPGLTANDNDSSGQALINWTNFVVSAAASLGRCSSMRSREVNTTAYGWPSTSSRRH